MNKSFIARLCAVVLVAGFGLVFVFVSPARAQTGTPPATTAPAAPTTTPPPVLNDQNAIPIILIILAGALSFYGIFFYYINSIHHKYYEVTEDLAKFGISVAPTTSASEPFSGAADREIAATVTVEFKGPSSVVVGVPSADFTATIGLKPPTDEKLIAWSVSPANAATVNPPTGMTVKVMAAIPGAFVLTASYQDVTAQKAVAAIASQPSKADLSVFGRGYGSIAIAIIVLAAVVILGLGNVLPSAAIATLLGGLLGYIFGQHTSEAAASSSDTQAKTQQPK